jgi:hypothetical protein
MLFQQWFRIQKPPHPTLGLFCVVLAAGYVVAVTLLVAYALVSLLW